MTNPHSTVRLIQILCLSLASSLAAQTTSPATRPVGEPVAALSQGKTDGTFHLVFSGEAKFAMPGHCALVVSVESRFRHHAGRLQLDDAGSFVFEADVKPGSYLVLVSPADEKNADYWPAKWQQIHLDKHGNLYRMNDAWSKPGPFVLDRRMKDLSPADGATASENPPELKWPAVEGATHYRGYYGTGSVLNPFDVDEPHFVIGAGVGPTEGCRWQVEALDANGKLLARGEASFLGKGASRLNLLGLFASKPAQNPEPLPAERSYLGIRPMPTQVPKDPQTPPNSLEGGTVEDRAAGFIPGLMVADVAPNSPAIDADIIPDDVIIAIDGKPIASEDNMGDYRAVIAQISAMEPGRQIALTIRRFPHELTLHATVARLGAPPTTAPATVAVNPTTAPAPAPVAANTNPYRWRGADAGSPAVFAFKAPAADFTLTMKDGLASDAVNCVAELPGGGMAFGTQDGLSIWDGSEIRTYTGPSLPGPSGEAKHGNSPLPGTFVQDLLCDSKGRLWVATNGGVCRIDTPKSKVWHVLEKPGYGAFSNRWLDPTLDGQRLFQMSDGTIVLGGRNEAIILIDPQTDTPRLIHQQDEMNHWVTGIAEDAQRRLWLSITGVGVMRYDGKQLQEVKGSWIKAPTVLGLVIDGTGTIWIDESAEGLGALHPDGTTETIAKETLPGDFVTRIAVDRKGRLWVAGSGGFAVHVADKDHPADKSWEYTPPVEMQYIRSIYNASDGAWWILDNGASRQTDLKLSTLNPRTQAIARLKSEVEKAYPNIKSDSRTMIGVKGIAVGIANRQIFRYDGKTWEDLSGKIGQADVYQLFADADGTIWIATSGEGLIGLDPGGQIRRFNKTDDASSVIYCLAQTPDGTLYAGTQHGVYRLRAGKWEEVKSDLFQVGQILVDKRGRLWLLEITYSKLYVYDGKFFKEVKEQTPIANEPIEALRLDDAGNILADIPARPAEKRPKRTFRWDASAEGKIGPPVEAK